MSLLLHNSIIFMAIYWAPRYFAIPFPREALQKHSNADLVFHDPGAVALMGDCVEVISLGSLNLLLQLYLYSSKLEHIHSIKMFVYVTTKGLIAFRSSIFGGGSPEPAGHEQVARSPAFTSFIQECADTKIVAFLDRGFTRTAEQGNESVHLLFPTSGEQTTNALSASHAVWRQVPLTR
jgi:hypothetical protein